MEGSTSKSPSQDNPGTPPKTSDDKASDENPMNIRFLLHTGESKNFRFNPTDTVQTVKRIVYENWPQEWSKPAPKDPSNITLIYCGRFLEPSDLLSSYETYSSRILTIHLLVNNSSEDTKDNSGDSKTSNKKQRKCCRIS